MQKQTIKKNIYYLFVFTLIILGIFFYFQKNNVVTSYITETPQIAEAISLPEKLIIPKINVDADVEEVGITEEGKMGVPEISVNVGWYKFGAIPGEEGSAVIAGHFDDLLGAPLVFSRLDELEIGDDIYVINKEGEELNFKVTGKELYDHDSYETEAIFGSTNKKHLSLITCNGIILEDIEGYDKRLVIFAEAL